jgi:hypothetical protein
VGTVARSLAASHVESHRDERGVVYLEFLLAFMPVFLMFLAICQLALMHTAALVVRHAAYVAARSAIVVLEDDPERYDDAPRGRVSAKKPPPGAALPLLLSALGLARGELLVPDLPTSPTSDGSEGDEDEVPPQQGARMVPIRSAAYVRLLTLAPRSASEGERDTVLSSISSGLLADLPGALAYTQSAAVVTLHQNGAEHLALEPIPRAAPITARVTYLYTCRVPVVRAVMCPSLASLIPPAPDGARQESNEETAENVLAARMRLAERPSELERVVGPSARVTALSADVTLPNQGAAYVYAEAP